MKKTFRIIAFLEGVSYILLLFIAVPVKYVFDEPLYVKLLGMPHGILFVCYVVMCFFVTKYESPCWVLCKNEWPKGSKNYKKSIAVILSLIITFIFVGLIRIIGQETNKLVILSVFYLMILRYLWKRLVAKKTINIPDIYIFLIASILPFGTFYIEWKYLKKNIS